MVCVALSHYDALVTRQLLHLVEVLAILNEPGCEGVPKIVKVEIGYPCLLQRLPSYVIVYQ